MIFEYGETNRISGFTLSISIPPSARPTYSFVLDWEKRKESKTLLSDDNEKTGKIERLSSERTIKDINSLSSAGNNSESSTFFNKSSTTTGSRKFGGDCHSEFERKIEMGKQHADMKNQIYDNLESYKRSIDNDSMPRNNLIELKVIIRYYKNKNETMENIVTDKVTISSTLIDALKLLLRNTSISLIGNDYGRLFLFPDRKRNDKIRELSYDQNRYKQLTEFCKSGSRCTLLLDLTNTFLKQAS